MPTKTMFLMEFRKILSGVKQEDRAQLVYEYMTQFAPVVTPLLNAKSVLCPWKTCVDKIHIYCPLVC